MTKEQKEKIRIINYIKNQPSTKTKEGINELISRINKLIRVK